MACDTHPIANPAAVLMKVMRMIRLLERLTAEGGQRVRIVLDIASGSPASLGQAVGTKRSSCSVKLSYRLDTVVVANVSTCMSS